MSRQLPLKLTYNNQLIADEKPYLPIIGNKIPSKQIATFDGLDALTFTQLTGTATGAYDNVKSYHSTACYKVSLAASSSASVTLNFNTPIDLNSLGTQQNGYTTINQTGKYGNVEDQLFFVINLLYQISAGTSQFQIQLFNGIKYAQIGSRFLPSQTSSDSNKFHKMQWQYFPSFWDYVAGFADSDFSNITSIVLTFTGNSSGTSVYYLQDIFSALPKAAPELPFFSNSYYPLYTESNSIFVSQLFGNDKNTGTTKVIGAAVRTIEQGIALALAAARTYIVLLDSATYKPIALDGSYVGIQQSLTNNITIIADYLETPTISAEPGLFDAERVGARATLRTAFYENTSGSGNILTVGSGGTYATIGAANSAASAGDCIQIIDSGTYTALLTCDKNITIEATPGTTPVWNVNGNVCLDIDNHTVNVFGITFKGIGADGEQKVKVGASGILDIEDCSFSGIGSNTSGTASAIYLNPTGTDKQTINNCLFTNNGEYFTAINNVPGSSGKTMLINCLGNMGTTNNNALITSAYANTNPLNTTTVGCMSLSSYTTKITNAYFYVNPSQNATTTVNFSCLLCDTNEVFSFPKTNGIVLNATILNNYIHDVYLATTDPLINTYPVFTNSTLTLHNNLFENITGTTTYVFRQPSSGTYNLNYNIFNNCHSTICLYIATNLTISGNVFNNCNKCYGINHTPSTIQNSIFNNCKNSVSIELGGGGTVYMPNNIVWNSPVNDPTSLINYSSGPFVTDQNPNFIDPANGNFGWYYNSPIEVLPEGLTSAIQNWALNSPIINASGAQLNLQFLDIEGFYNTCLLSAVSSTTTATYCNINNSLIGKYNVNAQVHLYNCFMTGNGQAIRENNSVIASVATQTTNKNNIIDTNGTGIMLLSGSDIEYNTIVNNNYGITNIFTGYYNQTNYMNQYVTLKNNIVARNAAWDYVGTLQTDYSIIPNRYFDSLPITSILYVNTVGPHDQSGQPEIDAPDVFNIAFQIYTYFPNTIFNGFLSNSPAWQAASDTYLNGQGQTVNLNIGARSIPAISTQLDYAQYDLNYVGNIANGKDEFYALENPNEIKYILQPINNESYRQIDGQYFNDPTAYSKEIELNWITPGVDSKLLDTGRAAFEGAFMSIWVVGLSMDSGVTFVYFKVDKGSSIEMSPHNFLYNDTQTEPYGNFKLHLITMPDKFVITDYLTNNLGE